MEALRSWHVEKLRYPTQKPLALLERIVEASSNPGDTVLDPFCGCGTTIEAAQKLGRSWLGIDVTPFAVSLIKSRLSTFEGVSYRVIGEPVDVAGAEQLALDNRHHFQAWALGLVYARPIEVKIGADKGVDGRINFHEGDSSKPREVIISVKSGHVQARDVRDLAGTVESQGAALGLLITLEPPTKPMLEAAASYQFYVSPTWHQRYAKIQILTVADLLGGKTIDMPPRRQTDQTLKRARPRQAGTIHQTQLMPVSMSDPELLKLAEELDPYEPELPTDFEEMPF